MKVKLGKWKFYGVHIIWYDLWIGLYLKPDGTRIYFAPIPCVVFVWGRGDYIV